MAKKKLNINNIPQLITWSSAYCVDVDWRYLERNIAEHTDRHGLILEPDFQRHHCWTLQQRTAYIEHILCGGYSGRELLFNHPGWLTGSEGVYVLVDGLQRITSVCMFLRDEVPIFGGHFYSQCDGHLRLFHSFKWYINTLPTRADVLRWYLQINSGGTRHTAKELARVRQLLEEEASK